MLSFSLKDCHAYSICHSYGGQFVCLERMRRYVFDDIKVKTMRELAQTTESRGHPIAIEFKMSTSPRMGKTTHSQESVLQLREVRRFSSLEELGSACIPRDRMQFAQLTRYRGVYHRQSSRRSLRENLDP
eukprot:TRINITY_DN7328_c0_g1_i7.p1 TRINITY_DN7328_c0_g1~~TRINITY_DN7328_c0_g1_i7.p1  ORF type:complete len:130 (+),score=0.87 TRINITY_DN7328_c0_g1_i7:94-483(+)